MNKKFKPDSRGFVFSTDPDFKFKENRNLTENTLLASEQKIKIRLDTKHRAGKAVTLITNFTGTEFDLIDLEKKVKNFCGTGGSIKNFEIIIQGDQRQKLLQWFHKNGYNHTKII